MFIGCQFALYPMADRFVEMILDAVAPLRERSDLRVATHDLGTLLIGPPRPLFAAVEQSFLRAAAHGGHVVLSATFSRGCPGEPDDPICRPQGPSGDLPALDPPRSLPPAGIPVAAQFALYPLGVPSYMDIIYREIGAAREAGTCGDAMHFATRLVGDARHVFATIYNAFERAAADAGHVVVTATVSAGSPTRAGGAGADISF